MEPISFSLSSVPAADISSADIDEFNVFVRRSLADPMGWPAHGYLFIEKKGASPRHVSIALSPMSVFSDAGMEGFSFYDPSRAEIHINVSNWRGASPASRDGLYPDIWRYRLYMINHEMGHHLGHLNGSRIDHFIPADERLPAGSRCPVMTQQTRGTAWCRGLEANPYPIAEDLLVIGHPSSKQMRGGASSMSGSSLILLLIIGLLLLLGLMWLGQNIWKRLGYGGFRAEMSHHEVSHAPYFSLTRGTTLL